MDVVRKLIKTNALPTSLENPTPFDDRPIGFWGIVTKVYSNTNRVDVESSRGFIYYGIPVLSTEWVCDQNNEYVSGSRNLPPIGTRVFVLMPTYDIPGSFVLCSGYAAGENSTHNLYAKNDSDIEKYNSIKEKISVSGWNTKEYYTSGNKTLISKDENLEIKLGLEEDSENSIIEGIEINAWKNIINVTEDGIKIKDKNDIEIILGENGIEVYLDTKSKSQNYVKISSSGITMKGTNGTLDIS